MMLVLIPIVRVLGGRRELFPLSSKFPNLDISDRENSLSNRTLIVADGSLCLSWHAIIRAERTCH